MNILMVASTTTVGSLTAREVIERNKLIGLGHTVTLRDHNSAAPSSFSGIDLVILSGSVQSNLVNPKYDAVACGVTTWDARKYPHTYISSQNFASGGNARTNMWFNDDTATDNISGPLYTNAETVVYPVAPTDTYYYVDAATQLPASAKQWMRRDGTSNDIAGFGFEVGAAMATGGGSNAGGRKSVIGIQNPNEVTASAIDSYIQRVLTWTANGGNAPPPADTTAPTQATLGVSGSGYTRILTASGATDDVGVTAYLFHLSTTNGFTSSGTAGGAGNCIAVDADGVYTLGPLDSGTYYVRARAQDLAGNIGPESAQSTITITDPVAAPAIYFGTSGVASSEAQLWFATSASTSIRVDNT